MSLVQPRAVIFDWDNTLVDTWPIIHEALAATFTEMGRAPWTLDEVKSRVRKSMRDSFPELFGEDWRKAADLYQAHYRRNHLVKLTPLPRAEELLRRVRELKLYSVVVSNKKGGSLRLEADHLGWLPLFDNVIGSDDAARDKPHADPVHLAFEESGIAPGRDVWFVGDSEIDLECAENCGCTAILYGEWVKDRPGYTKSHYQGFPYQAHVHDHSETLALLNNV